MNPSWKGIALGLMLLAILDALVSRPAAAAATGGAWKFANDALNRFISPEVALFPTSSSSSSSSSSSTSTTTASSGTPVFGLSAGEVSTLNAGAPASVSSQLFDAT